MTFESFDWMHAGAFGLILSLFATAYLVIVLRLRPRTFLRNYPKAIRDVVPPLTAQERWQSLFVALPYLLLLVAIPAVSAIDLSLGRETEFGSRFLDAFLVGMVFNVVDLVVIDIVWLGWFPPSWMVLAGSEHVSYRPEYAMHVRGFLVGSVIAALVAIVIAFTVPA